MKPLVAFLVIIIIGLIGSHFWGWESEYSKAEKVCQDAGGQYVSLYSADDLCISKSVVIDLP